MREYVIKLIESNENIKKIINEIYYSKDNINELINNLNKEVFVLFCNKGYLENCEPEYCSIRITKQCSYIEAIDYLKKKYKIDLIKKEIL